MIRHVVLLQWLPGTTSEQVAALSAGLSSLPGLVGTMAAYTHGPDTGLVVGGFDYGIVADFADVDDWRTYDEHDEHNRVRRELITPLVAARASVRFEL
jgi:hypothetical protein